MPRYNELAATVLRLDPAIPLERDYFLLRFPGHWKEPLRRLAQARRGGDDASIPIASLNEAITALIPDCVVTLKRAGQGNEDEDWLLAYREINPHALFALVAAWVRAQQVAPEQIASTLSQLAAADLAWSKLTINLTAPEQRDWARRLLPMEIAATLSRPNMICPHGNLQFRRCATDMGAELMSWPPSHIEEGTPFSAKIGISAQTIPTSDELFIYLSFGVRRWMPIRGRLAFDHGHNVYLAPTVPYLSGLDNSRHFGRARIRQTKVTDADGTTSYQPRWDDALARVLAEAGCLHRLPDPAELVNHPLDYLQRDGDAAALVYSTGMLKRETVSAGLSLADREPLMTWAAEALAPALKVIDPLARERTTIYKGLAGVSEGTIPPERICDAIDGPRVTFELLTATPEATQYALNHLRTRLGVRLPRVEQLGEDEKVITHGPLTIGIRHLRAPEIRADLDRTVHKKRSLQAAVEDRITLTMKRLGKVAHPTATLVEIQHPDEYQGSHRGNDPKFAIRHGLLLTGRISQFVTPVTTSKRSSKAREGQELSDPNQERFAAAIDDLFRQLGIRPAPLPMPAPGTLERPPALLGIWVIRQNRGQVWGVARQVPVAVLIDPNGDRIRVQAPEVGWRPLHDGLRAIGERYVNVETKRSPGDIVRFVEDTVREVISDYPDVLLLTHSQNLRSAWKSIANNRIQVNAIEFAAGASIPIARFPGLRHVRVRTVEGGETPECYGINGDDTGQPQGLWRFLPPLVFGSTSGKPSTASGALKGTSKLVSLERNGRLVAPQPKAQVWNAQLVEFFVAACQEGDRPEHWAALAHDLRDAAPYARSTTTLPWPLHLAEQIEEYLLPTRITHLEDDESTSDD